MTGLEHGIADVFASLQNWLVSSGATRSMMQLAWAVLTFLWLTVYAVAIPRAGRLLRASRVARIIEGVAGLTLIGLGVRVATEER